MGGFNVVVVVVDRSAVAADDGDAEDISMSGHAEDKALDRSAVTDDDGDAEDTALDRSAVTDVDGDAEDTALAGDDVDEDGGCVVATSGVNAEGFALSASCCSSRNRSSAG